MDVGSAASIRRGDLRDGDLGLGVVRREACEQAEPGEAAQKHTRAGEPRLGQ